MKVKDIIDVDTVNYKKISMFIAMTKCDFKCDRECGKPVCQNSELAKAPNIEIDWEEIIKRYLNNPMSEAVTIGGLEPFDTFDALSILIFLFRHRTQDDIVIYTGYYPNEIAPQLKELQRYDNIIVKFGRFIPDRPHRYDELLGVELSSDNQFARRLEDC